MYSGGFPSGGFTPHVGIPSGGVIQSGMQVIPNTQVVASQPARLVVKLPAEAKLTLDDHVTKSTSDRRVFVTPPLTPGVAYQYTLRAEVMQDGELKSVVRKVTVQAGQDTEVELAIPGMNPAAD